MTKHKLLLAVVTVLVAARATLVTAAEDNEPAALVHVGAARVDVTPQFPIRMAGYASRNKESQRVAQKLWAKALAIGDDRQGPAVLVSVDNCNVPGFLIEEVAERLKEKAGIRRERFAVCVTHTHSGPLMPRRHPTAYPDFSPEEKQRMERYAAQMGDWLEQVALKALADRRPGRLAWTQGKVGFAANRRALKGGKWAGFGVQRDGPVDHDLPMLVVSDPDGKLRAVFTSYACHATTIAQSDPRFYHLHGDWPGVAQQRIETAHSGVLAILATGCGADANPGNRGSMEAAEKNGKAIADEVERLLRAELRPLPGVPTCRLVRFPLPLDPLPSREELKQQRQQPGWAGRFAATLLERLDRGEKLRTELPYCVQTWTFGDELAMVLMPGEVVVDYSLRLKKELDGKRLWVIAYANGTPAYIVTKRMLGEGGYEVDASRRFYDLPTRLAAEAEELIVGKVHELLPRGFGVE